MPRPIKLGARQHNRTVEQTLKQALRDNAGLKLQCVMVIGFDADGEFYNKAARLDNGNGLWLVEAAR